MTTDELIKVLQKVGIHIARVGNNNLHGLCPHHEESRPSWGIITNPPHFHGCFSCGYKGTLRSLLLDKGWSLVRVTNLLGPEVQKESKLSFKPSSKKDEPVGVSKQNLWPYGLEKPATQYMKTRGITKHTMKQTGLLYHRADNRVLFPWWIGDTFLGATGRRIDDDLFGQPKIISYFGLSKKYLYLPLGELDCNREVILVEGEIDALHVLQAGFTNVAALGRGTFSKSIADWLENLPVKSLCLFFDDDLRGFHLTCEVSETMGSICPIYTVDYPQRFRHKVHDPAEFTKAELQRRIKRKRKYFTWASFRT